MTVSSYVDTIATRTYTPFIITPEGKGDYLYNGERMERRDFERLFPLPISLVTYKGNTADATKQWLHE